MALDFIAGCLGGCAGVVIGHPFDTVKVKLQTQDLRRPVYRGTWDCFTKILQTESLAGVYRGVWSPMCGVALVNAVVFGVYGNLQRRLVQPDSPSAQFLAGAAAGLAQSLVSSPVELVKTKMQTSPSYQGTMECLMNILKSKGGRGMFKGLPITGTRDSLGYGLYFATYEFLTRSSPDAPVGTSTMLLAGGISGSVSWILTYPLDVVKTRFQADIGRYFGLVDCFRKSVQNEGFACLSRGLLPTVMRAFPTNAVTFTVVTWAMRLTELSFESVDVTEIVDSVVDKLPKEKHLITADVHESVNNKFNFILQKNAQRYFLLSEGLRAGDGLLDELAETNNGFDNDHQPITNKVEADLLAAELKMFDNFTNKINQSDFDIYRKIIQMEEEFKKDNR